jgi:hypothetical protein
MNLERTRGENCLSDLCLDRWSRGELTGQALQQTESHLAQCAPCRARRDALFCDAEAFALNAPRFEVLLGAELKQGVEHRQASRLVPIKQLLSQHWRWMAVASSLAVAASLLLVMVPDRHPEDVGGIVRPSSSDKNATRIKGGKRLLFHVLRGGEVTPGQSGQTVRPGDALRFSVSTMERAYVTVLSVDGAGVVSIYHPQGQKNDLIEPGSLRTLSTAVKLDATLGKELLYGIFCSTPVAPSVLRDILEKAPGAPRFPDGCDIDVLTVAKERL